MVHVGVVCIFCVPAQRNITVLSTMWEGDDGSGLEEVAVLQCANVADPNEEKRIMDAIMAGRGGAVAFDNIIQELALNIQSCRREATSRWPRLSEPAHAMLPSQWRHFLHSRETVKVCGQPRKWRML